MGVAGGHDGKLSGIKGDEGTLEIGESVGRNLCPCAHPRHTRGTPRQRLPRGFDERTELVEVMRPEERKAALLRLRQIHDLENA